VASSIKPGPGGVSAKAAELEKTVQELKEQLGSSQQQIEDHLAEVKELQEDAAQRQTSFSEIQAENEELRSVISDLDAKRANEGAKAEELKNNEESYLQQLAASQAKVEEQLIEIGDLKEKMNKSNEAIVFLRHEHNVEVDAREALEQKYDAVCDELERVKQVHLQQEIQAIEKKSVEAQLESDKSVQKDSAAMALKEVLNEALHHENSSSQPDDEVEEHEEPPEAGISVMEKFKSASLNSQLREKEAMITTLLAMKSKYEQVLESKTHYTDTAFTQTSRQDWASDEEDEDPEEEHGSEEEEEEEAGAPIGPRGDPDVYDPEEAKDTEDSPNTAPGSDKRWKKRAAKLVIQKRVFKSEKTSKEHAEKPEKTPKGWKKQVVAASMGSKAAGAISERRRTRVGSVTLTKDIAEKLKNKNLEQREAELERQLAKMEEERTSMKEERKEVSRLKTKLRMQRAVAMFKSDVTEATKSAIALRNQRWNDLERLFSSSSVAMPRAEDDPPADQDGPDLENEPEDEAGASLESEPASEEAPSPPPPEEDIAEAGPPSSEPELEAEPEAEAEPAGQLKATAQPPETLAKLRQELKMMHRAMNALRQSFMVDDSGGCANCLGLEATALESGTARIEAEEGLASALQEISDLKSRQEEEARLAEVALQAEMELSQSLEEKVEQLSIGATESGVNELIQKFDAAKMEMEDQIKELEGAVAKEKEKAASAAKDAQAQLAAASQKHEALANSFKTAQEKVVKLQESLKEAEAAKKAAATEMQKQEDASAAAHTQELNQVKADLKKSVGEAKAMEKKIKIHDMEMENLRERLTRGDKSHDEEVKALKDKMKELKQAEVKQTRQANCAKCAAASDRIRQLEYEITDMQKAQKANIGGSLRAETHNVKRRWQKTSPRLSAVNAIAERSGAPSVSSAETPEDAPDAPSSQPFGDPACAILEQGDLDAEPPALPSASPSSFPAQRTIHAHTVHYSHKAPPENLHTGGPGADAANWQMVAKPRPLSSMSSHPGEWPPLLVARAEPQEDAYEASYKYSREFKPVASIQQMSMSIPLMSTRISISPSRRPGRVKIEEPVLDKLSPLALAGAPNELPTTFALQTKDAGPPLPFKDDPRAPLVMPRFPGRSLQLSGLPPLLVPTVASREAERGASSRKDRYIEPGHQCIPLTPSTSNIFNLLTHSAEPPHAQMSGEQLRGAPPRLNSTHHRIPSAGGMGPTLSNIRQHRRASEAETISPRSYIPTGRKPLTGEFRGDLHFVDPSPLQISSWGTHEDLPALGGSIEDMVPPRHGSHNPSTSHSRSCSMSPRRNQADYNTSADNSNDHHIPLPTPVEYVSDGAQAELTPSRSDGAQAELTPSRSDGAQAELTPSQSDDAQAELTPSRSDLEPASEGSVHGDPEASVEYPSPSSPGQDQTPEVPSLSLSNQEKAWIEGPDAAEPAAVDGPSNLEEEAHDNPNC
ncbi:hypothetical protein CYMTET_23566, partial [Cymbomonas tetramitiformis]